mgnify:CR=1 FL=1|jgi:hypothetical protein
MKKDIIELEDLPSISINEFASHLMIEQNSDEDKVMICLPMESVKTMIDVLKKYL